jgi:hypothetical protein
MSDVETSVNQEANVFVHLILLSVWSYGINSLVFNFTNHDNNLNFTQYLDIYVKQTAVFSLSQNLVAFPHQIHRVAANTLTKE